MSYIRPDIDDIKKRFKELIQEFRTAAGYPAAKQKGE